MTVSNTTNKVSYTADGVLTDFDFSFGCFDETDIVVVIRDGTTGVEETKVLDTDYTISAVNNDFSTGGTVSFITAPDDDDVVIIYRQLQAVQPSDFDYNDDFDATKVENGLDRLCYLIQQANEILARALRLPVSDSGNTVEIPNSVDRASKFLAFDSLGNPIASALSSASLETPITSFGQTLLSLSNAAALTALLSFGAAASKGFKDEDDMASDDDASVPSQQSVKAYVDALSALCVKLTGAQTVNGVKTFGAIPVLPASDPTAANEATRKGYVDGLGFVSLGHNRLGNSKLESGSATSTLSGKLVDSAATFVTNGIVAGHWVYNRTDATIAEVVSVDSETQLTLSSNIMASGENYDVGNLKINNEYVNFDFSSYIPVGAKAAVVRLVAESSVADKFFHVRPAGENKLPWITLGITVANIWHYQTGICALDADRNIEYYIDKQTAGSSGWSGGVYLVLLGYFI